MYFVLQYENNPAEEFDVQYNDAGRSLVGKRIMCVSYSKSTSNYGKSHGQLRKELRGGSKIPYGYFTDCLSFGRKKCSRHCRSYYNVRFLQLMASSLSRLHRFSQNLYELRDSEKESNELTDNIYQPPCTLRIYCSNDECNFTITGNRISIFFSWEHHTDSTWMLSLFWHNLFESRIQHQTWATESSTWTLPALPSKSCLNLYKSVLLYRNLNFIS